jgi:hypothetical protein
MTAVLSLPPPDFEVASAYPVVGRLRQAAQACDWAAIRAFAASMPHGSDRTIIAMTVADVPGVERPLRELVAANPNDLLAATLLASREVTIGWGVRTDARATHVSRDQFEVFHRHLRQAEQLLIRVIAVDSANDLAWTERLNTARGLQLGQNEARRRHDRLTRHHPGHFTGQARLLQQLCPKWGGSWEAAHAFARECMLSAPAGALNAGLVAEAHLEHWEDLKDKNERAEYLRLPHVHHELVQAAERSVLHPAFQRPFGWVIVQGTFAAMFSLIGDLPRAAVHFRGLGNLASRYPWSYLGDPAGAYARHRAAAFAKG